MNKRLIVTDVLKALAIIFVILTHVAYPDGFNKKIYTYSVYEAVAIFMVITGIHYTMSYERLKSANENENLEWYRNSVFTKKITRILVPYTIAFFATLYVLCGYGHQKFILINWIKYYLKGGVGPGGYFTSQIIQIIIIFPFIYKIVDRFKVLGSIWIGVVFSIAYEYFVKYFGISQEFYRLCCFRQVFLIILGAVFIKYYKELKDTSIPCIIFIVGFIYITATSYFGYKDPIITSWNGGSFMGGMYAAGIVFACLILNDRLALFAESNFIFKGISFVGKASLQIFLFQQFWFVTGFEKVLLSKLRYRYLIPTEVIVCVICGILFYVLCNMLYEAYYKIKDRVLVYKKER